MHGQQDKHNVILDSN